MFERPLLLRGERGAALFTVALLAFCSIALVGAAFTTSLAKVGHVDRQLSEAAAFNAAESGLNAAIEDVWRIYVEQDPAERVEYMERLDGKYAEDERYEVVDRQMGRSVYTVKVEQALAVGSNYADLEFVCVAENGGARRSISAVVRYAREPSEVFDHVYFINNFGWMWGSGITVNGSVRSNGNFSLKNATVNGDVYASENEAVGATGEVSGTSNRHTIDDYNATFGTQARPTNPSAPSEDLNLNGKLDAGEDANGNGVLDTYEYADGYDGESARFEQQPAVEMPYLGDLEVYLDLAERKGGTVSQGGKVIVDAILGDDANEPRDILLVGTEDDPIVVDGPVVVMNDVVIEGRVTGCGTIYAGRNIHVVGDVVYMDPPVWEKPLTDQESARESNLGKDMLGLAAKGSVILGDYTQNSWKSTTKNYQKPPFTQPYEVEESDDDIGYVSYYDGNGVPMFDGDYTDYDGGTKDALDSGPGGSMKALGDLKNDLDTSDLPEVPESRRYYESSFPDEIIEQVAQAKIERIDAIIYTNHLFSGLVNKGVINGTVVSRDEAVIYTSTMTFNYDVRVRNGGYEFIDIFLPREPSVRVVSWAQR